MEFFDFISKYDDFISNLISIGTDFSSENRNSLKELEESIELIENFIIENSVDHEDEKNYWDIFSKEKGKEVGSLGLRLTTLNDLKNEPIKNLDCFFKHFNLQNNDQDLVDKTKEQHNKPEVNVETKAELIGELKDLI